MSDEPTDEELGEALGDLPVPEVDPEFWRQVKKKIDEEE